MKASFEELVTIFIESGINFGGYSTFANPNNLVQFHVDLMLIMDLMHNVFYDSSQSFFTVNEENKPDIIDNGDGYWVIPKTDDDYPSGYEKLTDYPHYEEFFETAMKLRVVLVEHCAQLRRQEAAEKDARDFGI